MIKFGWMKQSRGIGSPLIRMAEGKGCAIDCQTQTDYRGRWSEVTDQVIARGGVSAATKPWQGRRSLYWELACSASVVQSNYKKLAIKLPFSHETCQKMFTVRLLPVLGQAPIGLHSLWSMNLVIKNVCLNWLLTGKNLESLSMLDIWRQGRKSPLKHWGHSNLHWSWIVLVSITIHQKNLMTFELGSAISCPMSVFGDSVVGTVLIYFCTVWNHTARWIT